MHKLAKFQGEKFSFYELILIWLQAAVLLRF